MNVNQWIGVGRVTRDPEVKSVGNSKVASFRIAVNRSFKKGNEWVEKPMFIDCEAWALTAERVEKSVSKGTELFIRGRLESDEWNSRDSGEKRVKHKIYVLELQIEKSRREDSSSEKYAMSNSVGDESEGFDSKNMPF